MKKIVCASSLLLILSVPANSESLLSAQSFPTTIQDLSFVDKMELLKDVYEPYAAVYDKDGYCVENCAYPGLHIEQEKIISERDTAAALKQSENFEKAAKNMIDNTASKLSANMYKCQNYNPEIPSGQKVPKSEPLMGKPFITSGYGARILEGVTGYHDALDYRATEGTLVYAPADGQVVFAGDSGKCGKTVKLKHDDGTQTIYCHLSEINVYKGDYVQAGCSFAKTGNTGHSTGPHLHYAMKDSKGNKINPAGYTKRGKNSG